MPLLIAISKYSILLFLCQGNNHLFNDIFLYYIGKYEQKLLVLPTKRLEKCISSIVGATLGSPCPPVSGGW